MVTTTRVQQQCHSHNESKPEWVKGRCGVLLLFCYCKNHFKDGIIHPQHSAELSRLGTGVRWVINCPKLFPLHTLFARVKKDINSGSPLILLRIKLGHQWLTEVSLDHLKRSRVSRQWGQRNYPADGNFFSQVFRVPQLAHKEMKSNRWANRTTWSLKEGSSRRQTSYYHSTNNR